MNRQNGKLEFSPTIDISLLREAGVDLSSQFTIIPGFCDVHVHFREPGFSYKETIATGAKAAAHGGYTAVCTMPNLNPVSDTPEHLAEQQRIIDEDACIHVYPYAAITIGQKGEELADLEAMADDCISFSDDGHGVQSDDMMRAAMLKAKSLGKIITAHCEVNSLLNGGYVCRRARAQRHMLGVRVGTDSEGPQACEGDRLRIPRMSHIHQGERGHNPQSQGRGR